jgi:hypothetical protein
MTITPTEPSKLPQWKGRPVPWVTRWSNEVIREPYTLEMTREAALSLIYKDGKSEDRAYGALWQREGLMRGGDPLWKSVSTYRQRRAMTRCLCQVCGEKIDERPIRFLMPMDGIEMLDENTALTIQAPTCESCIPLALSVCPHLKKFGYQILKVIDYEPWGVYGEVVWLGNDMKPQRMQTYVGFDMHNPPKFSLSQVLAKQLVIKLGKYVAEVHAPE